MTIGMVKKRRWRAGLNLGRVVDWVKRGNFVDVILLIIPVLVISTTVDLYSVSNPADTDFPLNPFQNFMRSLSVWSEWEFCGFDQSFSNLLQLFPYSTVIALLSFLNLPLGIIQKIWFFSIFLLCSFSMYYMTYNLTQKNRVASIVSALTFTYNPWTMIRMSDGHHLLTFSYALIPFVVAFFVKAIEEDDLKYVLFSAFGLMLMTPGRIATMMTLLIIGLYFVYWNLVTRKSRAFLRSLRILGEIAVLSLLLNMWWLLPLTSSLGLREVYGVPSSEFFHYSRFTQLTNVFRLYGYWVEWMLRGARGLQGVIAFIFPILAFSAPIVAPKNKRVVFFAVLATISVFLSTGCQPPLDEFYLWMGKNLPYFALFRDPYKFVALTCFTYAFLIGVTAMQIEGYIRRATSRIRIFLGGKVISLNSLQLSIIPVIILCVLLLSNSSSFFTGLPGFSWTIKVPQYYEEANNWLNSQVPPEGNFKVFLMPRVYYVRYTWSFAIGQDASKHLFNRPTVGSSAGITVSSPTSTGFIEFLYNCIYYDRTRFAAKIIGITSSSFVIYRRDVEPIYEWSRSHDYLIEKLKRQNGLELVKEFGSLYIFKNNWSVPRIYATTMGIAVFGDWQKSLVSLSTVDSLKFDTSVLFFLETASASEREHFLDKSSTILFCNSFPPKDPGDIDYTNKRVVLLYEAEGLFDKNRQWVIQENPAASEAKVQAGEGTATAKFDLRIPKGGLYKFVLRVSSTAKEIFFRVDDESAISIPIPKGIGDFHWVEVGPFSLDLALHEIEIRNTHRSTEIDEIGCYSVRDGESDKTIGEILSPSEQKVSCEFSQISPTEYKVETSSQDPFFLVFTDSYDAGWVVHDEEGREEIKSSHAFAFANSYYVNKTGETTLTLRFVRQTYFYIGVGVSIATVIVCLLYVVMSKRLRKITHDIVKK